MFLISFKLALKVNFDNVWCQIKVLRLSLCRFFIPESFIESYRCNGIGKNLELDPRFLSK